MAFGYIQEGNDIWFNKLDMVKTYVIVPRFISLDIQVSTTQTVERPLKLLYNWKLFHYSFKDCLYTTRRSGYPSEFRIYWMINVLHRVFLRHVYSSMNVLKRLNGNYFDQVSLITMKIIGINRIKLVSMNLTLSLIKVTVPIMSLVQNIFTPSSTLHF